MRAHHLRAPSSDGTLLFQPPPEAAADALASNAARLAAWDHNFQGRRAGRLRRMVRKQVVERAKGFASQYGLDIDADCPSEPERLVITGHQPELFHPGVWVKNFATAGLAREAGGVGLNLIVDNDIPKSSEIRVPRRHGDRLSIERVAFDEWQGEIPYEDLHVADEARFATFGKRVRDRLAGEVIEPLVDDFWIKALASRDRTDVLGLRFALARHGVESSWGLRNLEVPLSSVCETEGFHWFVCHVLAELPRFRMVHNDALLAYRRLYGIRSRNHPVADLAAQGEWLEAPFWVWRADASRRRPLLVRQLARTMELRIAGEDATLAEIRLAPDLEACCAVDQLAEMAERGVRLRTRALTTTMFSRLLLGDLFVHGIGGAKYDELGDEITRRFFEFEPPTYVTLSMTLWLGLDGKPGASRRLAVIERTLRDLTWNPDRHLVGALEPCIVQLVEAKQAAIASPVDTKRQRLDRFHAIRRCNEALAGLVDERRGCLLGQRDRLAGEVRRNLIACSREYSLVLHATAHLKSAMGGTVPGLTVDGDSAGGVAELGTEKMTQIGS